ncbi:MAG: glycosyltransferase [Bacteroidales bacterium]|nr:glycosyltransferase [Bacteroidales bacterium]
MKTIVFSGISIHKGGTLKIFKECLSEAARLLTPEYRVIALVHDAKLYDAPGVEMVEIPEASNHWLKRLRWEFKEFDRLAQDWGEIELWFSIHDTTPKVKARRQVVYCQTSFPFMRVRPRDWLYDPKIPLLCLMAKHAYKQNARQNQHVVVQTHWLKEAFARLLGVEREKFIVFPPQVKGTEIGEARSQGEFVLFYPAFPDSHKNFELLCQAARLLEDKVGSGRFKVVITIDGTENRYARWLHKRWGDVKSIDFAGLQDREGMQRLYSQANALVFPSRVETWGLPISEFLATGRLMLLADAPYAHEASAGAENVRFFDMEDATALAQAMEEALNGAQGHPNPPIPYDDVRVSSWGELFEKILGTAP